MTIQKELRDWLGLTLQVGGPPCKRLSYTGRHRACRPEHKQTSPLGNTKDKENDLALWGVLQFYLHDTSQGRKGPNSESSLRS